MADRTQQATRTDVSPLRSWIITHPIVTFLVLVYATTTALVFVPKPLTESGLLPGGATPHGISDGRRRFWIARMDQAALAERRP
jgi:hypothetical protein